MTDYSDNGDSEQNINYSFITKADVTEQHAFTTHKAIILNFDKTRFHQIVNLSENKRIIYNFKSSQSFLLHMHILDHLLLMTKDLFPWKLRHQKSSRNPLSYFHATNFSTIESLCPM